MVTPRWFSEKETHNDSPEDMTQSGRGPNIRLEKVKTQQIKEGSARSGGIPEKASWVNTAGLRIHFETLVTTVHLILKLYMPGSPGVNTNKQNPSWLRGKSREWKGTVRREAALCLQYLRYEDSILGTMDYSTFMSWPGLSLSPPPTHRACPCQHKVECWDGEPRGRRSVSIPRTSHFPPPSYPNRRATSAAAGGAGRGRRERR